MTVHPPADRRHEVPGEGLNEREQVQPSGHLFDDQNETAPLALLEVVTKCTVGAIADVSRYGAPSTTRPEAGWLPGLTAQLGRDAPRYRYAEPVLVAMLASEDDGHAVMLPVH